MHRLGGPRPNRWAVTTLTALFATGWGCGTPASPPAAGPPAAGPPVVTVVEPVAVHEPVQVIEEPTEAVAVPQVAARGGCPFPAPAEQIDDSNWPVPAAPVLEHHKPAPRAVPPAITAAITQALDSRLAKGGTVSRSKLATQTRLLERLLKMTSPTDPDHGALIRRLAETQVDLAHAARKAQDRPAEARHRREAIRHYGSFKSRHPGDKALDQVLYHMALEHQRLGDLAEARKAYLELTQAVPQSKLVPRAYFAFGEMFFDEALGDPSKWPIAQRFYEEARKFPPSDHPVFGLAQYRLGHVHWRMNNPTQALEAFVKTLQYLGDFPKAPERKALRSAAMDGAIHSYAVVGRTDRACPFFHRLAATPPSSTATLQGLTRLGEAYLRTGRRAEAMTIYQLLEHYHRGPERRRDRTVLSSLRAP